MPNIDDGSADSGPGRPLKTAWITLSVEEGQELFEALRLWSADLGAGEADPRWHTHISDAAGNELTVAIDPT